MAVTFSNLLVGGTVEDCQNKSAPVLSQAFCNFTSVIGADIASEVNN